jgi:hypothetical protein
MSTKYLKLQIRSKNSQNVRSLLYSVHRKATCIRVQCMDNSYFLLTVSMFKLSTYTGPQWGLRSLRPKKLNEVKKLSSTRKFQNKSDSKQLYLNCSPFLIYAIHLYFNTPPHVQLSWTQTWNRSQHNLLKYIAADSYSTFAPTRAALEGECWSISELPTFPYRLRLLDAIDRCIVTYIMAQET